MKRRRLLSLFAVVLVACLAVPAVEKEPLSAYRARRDALRARLAEGPIVLYGNTEPEGPSAMWRFKQNEYFYYLTGVDEPGAVLLLAPTGAQASGGNRGPREILFLPARHATQERWTGPKLDPDDRATAEKLGFDAIMRVDALERELKRALPASGTLYTLLPAGHSDFQLREQADRLRALAPSGELRDARPELNRMRQVKSATELALMEKAARASMEAHVEAMKAARPGMHEYELAALMKYVMERQGCERPSYDPIVASGFYSTVLHYNANTRRMEDGDLVVLDVGGEYGGYAADITRTLPVSGRFTPRQREIYQIVLDAQKAAIAAIKPGMTIARSASDSKSIYKIAYDYIDSHGRDRQGRTLGRYFIHGLSHHLGLNVHDVGDVNRPLEPGMVITVEPGIYIPEESLGVRIEDIVLVTETGARVLTEGLVKEIDAVEAMMAARAK